MITCGIDFGTSNSSVALADKSDISLVPVEGSHITIPSAIFFSPVQKPAYGRDAINLFFERQEGRFMRSLKRVLGTSLMKQGTLVNNKLMKFDWIIASFLKNLREQTHAHIHHEVDHVVMGRPVHFVDDDNDADKRAQEELKGIARKVGFRYIEFQFEPIAAAFAHEGKVTGEKLALVADLGGGTSDFTVIRLSEKYITKTDRVEDILANTGVRIGGNDFDKKLSLSVIMPELGYKSTYGKKRLEVPLKYYHDLSEWSKVNFLYTQKVLSQVRQFMHESHDKNRLGRLLKLLEDETGHALLAKAEETKIALTSDQQYLASFDFIKEGLHISTDRKTFEDAIREEVLKIKDSAIECLRKASIQQSDIDLVILTGGSTEIPIIQQLFKGLFPKASVAEDNRLSSVGLGLAYDSQRRFR